MPDRLPDDSRTSFGNADRSGSLGAIFQTNDHIIHWGAIVKVVGIGKTSLEVKHIDPRYPQHAYDLPLVIAIRHQRGYWDGRLIPEHRREPSLIEPYEFSHIMPSGPPVPHCEGIR